MSPSESIPSAPGDTPVTQGPPAGGSAPPPPQNQCPGAGPLPDDCPQERITKLINIVNRMVSNCGLSSPPIPGLTFDESIDQQMANLQVRVQGGGRWGGRWGGGGASEAAPCPPLEPLNNGFPAALRSWGWGGGGGRWNDWARLLLKGKTLTPPPGGGGSEAKT